MWIQLNRPTFLNFLLATHILLELMDCTSLRLWVKKLKILATFKCLRYERYGQINTFLLQYYGTDFASIKRYDQFCLFTVVYKEAQIHPLVTLFILVSCYSFCSLCLSLFSLSLCPLSASSLSILYSLSVLYLPSLSILLLLSLHTLSPILNSLCFLCPLFLCFYTLYWFNSLPPFYSVYALLCSIICLSHVLVFSFFHKNNHVGRQFCL